MASSNRKAVRTATTDKSGISATPPHESGVGATVLMGTLGAELQAIGRLQIVEDRIEKLAREIERVAESLGADVFMGYPSATQAARDAKVKAAPFVASHNHLRQAAEKVRELRWVMVKRAGSNRGEHVAA